MSSCAASDEFICGALKTTTRDDDSRVRGARASQRPARCRRNDRRRRSPEGEGNNAGRIKLVATAARRDSPRCVSGHLRPPRSIDAANGRVVLERASPCENPPPGKCGGTSRARRAFKRMRDFARRGKGEEEENAKRRDERSLSARD